MQMDIAYFISPPTGEENGLQSPPLSRYSIIGCPCIIISKVIPRYLRVLPSVRKVETNAKETTAKISVLYV